VSARYWEKGRLGFAKSFEEKKRQEVYLTVAGRVRAAKGNTNNLAYLRSMSRGLVEGPCWKRGRNRGKSNFLAREGKTEWSIRAFVL